MPRCSGPLADSANRWLRAALPTVRLSVVPLRPLKLPASTHRSRPHRRAPRSAAVCGRGVLEMALEPIDLAELRRRLEEGDPFTEDALARRFSLRHAPDLRYIAIRAQWLRWDGTRWCGETTLLAFDLARE